jgi:MoxR-like ATPase
VDERIKDYIVELVTATRKPHPYVDRGASPRATLALANVSRAAALLAGRDFVLPDDVRDWAAPVLGHRLTYGRRLLIEQASPGDVVASIVASVRAP